MLAAVGGIKIYKLFRAKAFFFRRKQGKLVVIFLVIYVVYDYDL